MHKLDSLNFATRAQMKMLAAVAVLAAVFAGSVGPAHADEKARPPYADDPAILKIINGLEPGEGAFLPPTTSVEGGSKIDTGDALPKHGPSLKDFSNKMPYIPARQTAFHCGGGHNHQRYNDAWEYHLGSNTWIRLLASEGGDQGHIKYGWFVCRKVFGNPGVELSEKEKRGLEAIRTWFKEHMVIRDGYVQTKITGAGFMTSHTWDGLTYDPLVNKVFHYSGHSTVTDYRCWFVLMEDWTPENFEEKFKAFEKKLRPADTPMWAFDFNDHKWTKVYQKGSDVNVRSGSGAFMHYVPDLKKSICYQVHKPPYGMAAYDAVSGKMEDMNPNGGESLGTLRQKEIAPTREGQVAYSPRHKLLVDVHGLNTFIYDIRKNEWRKSAESRPLFAHDARTIFDYDSENDTFVLFGKSRSGKGNIWQMSLDDEKWTRVEPTGEVPAAFHGRGFYHPVHKVFVISSGSSTIWVYKPKPR